MPRARTDAEAPAVAPARASGTFAIGGELTVHRLGFGAMRLPAAWGEQDSLRRLRLDRIDLWQLHRIDPSVPIEEQFGAIRELRDEGKIRFVGVSEVTAAELAGARELVEIATVQNRYNVVQRAADEALAVCEAAGMGFMPWAPIRTGGQVIHSDALAAVAARH